MAAGDGNPLIESPASTSEFEAFIAAVRAFDNGSAGRMETVAYILRKELPRARNVSPRRGGMLGRAELMVAAVKISRHLVHAAACYKAAAVSLTKAAGVFHGTFSATSGQHSRGFDAGR